MLRRRDEQPPSRVSKMKRSWNQRFDRDTVWQCTFKTSKIMCSNCMCQYCVSVLFCVVHTHLSVCLVKVTSGFLFLYQFLCWKDSLTEFRICLIESVKPEDVTVMSSCRMRLCEDATSKSGRVTMTRPWPWMLFWCIMGEVVWQKVSDLGSGFTVLRRLILHPFLSI